MYNVFDKLRRYLFIWLLILLVLVVLTVIVYRVHFIELFTQGAAYMVSGLITCLIMIGAIWYLIRIIF